jgi:hypothetical protein
MLDDKTIIKALKDKIFFEDGSNVLLVRHIDAMRKVLSMRQVSHGKWPDKRVIVAFQQLIMLDKGIEVGAIDGLIGPQTLHALEQWQDRLRDIPGDPPIKKKRWPTQAEVTKFYGKMGTNIVHLTPPYQLYLYDTSTQVKTIAVHKLVQSSVERVLSSVLASYGSRDISRLHLDRFFGAFNIRKMRGGSGWSMHSWGIALDFDATRNQLRWGKDRAAFARPEYDKWNEAWEKEGWTSLGKERNYDWMHYQSAYL